jgi:hypothetical protein
MGPAHQNKSRYFPLKIAIICISKPKVLVDIEYVADSQILQLYRAAMKVNYMLGEKSKRQLI